MLLFEVVAVVVDVLLEVLGGDVGPGGEVVEGDAGLVGGAGGTDGCVGQGGDGLVEGVDQLLGGGGQGRGVVGVEGGQELGDLADLVVDPAAFWSGDRGAR